MEKQKLKPIKIQGCAHIDAVIDEKTLKEKGYFIPSDITKVHITFKNKK